MRKTQPAEPAFIFFPLRPNSMTENWPSRFPERSSEFSATGGNALSLLDPQETSPPNQLKPTYREQFLAGNEKEYEATQEAYNMIWTNPSASHIYNLNNCRRHAYFARDKVSGDVKIMTDSCRERWCPMCAGQKSKYAKESTQRWIETLDSPRFLTLTLKHCQENLLSQVEFLQDAFRRLRYRAYWKKRVTGGIWFLQVHRSENDGCWHPHFHILLDGVYLEHDKLSALWDLVTFGSPIIDIRRVNDPEESASYVARYSARPAKLAEMSIDDRVEMILALKGKRLSGTFGTAKTVTLTPPKISDGSEWQQIGYYDQIVSDANTNEAAKTILNAYLNDEPITEKEYFAYTGIEVNPQKRLAKIKEVAQYNLEFYNTF